MHPLDLAKIYTQTIYKILYIAIIEVKLIHFKEVLLLILFFYVVVS